MFVTAYTRLAMHSLTVIFFGMIIAMTVQANDQVRFSTQNNTLKIPFAVIDDQNQVNDVEMSLQSNGQFVLTQLNQQPSPQASLNEDFTLQMDQSIWLKGINSRLKLTAVTEDSRCPIEAICVREGTVSIVLSLYNGIDHAHDYQLSIGSENDDYRDIDNFRITLLSVNPAPPSISSKSADYNATFVITSLSGN